MPTHITQIDDNEHQRTVLRVEGDMMLADALLLERIASDIQTDLDTCVTIDLADLDFLDSDSAAVLRRLDNRIGFRIEGPTKKVLFIPDIDSWKDWDAAGTRIETEIAKVDVAYLDGTFYDGRELPERARAEIRHPPMVDTMERLRAWAASRPGAVRFIHLNHTNPVLHEVALPSAFRLAAVGEAIGL